MAVTAPGLTALWAGTDGAAVGITRHTGDSRNTRPPGSLKKPRRHAGALVGNASIGSAHKQSSITEVRSQPIRGWSAQIDLRAMLRRIAASVASWCFPPASHATPYPADQPDSRVLLCTCDGWLTGQTRIAVIASNNGGSGAMGLVRCRLVAQSK